MLTAVQSKGTHPARPSLKSHCSRRVAQRICASRSAFHLHRSESSSCILNASLGLGSDFWSVSFCELQPVAPACQPPFCLDEGERGHVIHAEFNFVTTERAMDGIFTSPLSSDEVAPSGEAREGRLELKWSWGTSRHPLACG